MAEQQKPQQKAEGAPQIKLTYGEINLGNVNQLSLLNHYTLPVKYSTGFYHKVATKYKKYSRFVFYNDIIIGAFTARTELYDEKNMAYILTFIVLQKYRKLKIGTQMMKQLGRMLKQEEKDKPLDGIYLHVHVKNQEAISFYKNQGFVIKERLDNYYKSIQEPHALVLMKLFN